MAKTTRAKSKLSAKKAAASRRVQFEDYPERLPRLGPEAALSAALTEWILANGSNCSTQISIAFIAAEMLMQFGRGQMAAQLGYNYSYQSASDYQAILNTVDLFQYPDNHTKPSITEDLFMGFVKSIANHQPATKKQRWKTAGNSDLPAISVLSFLVGNLAQQNRAVNPPNDPQNPNNAITRTNVKSAFDDVSSHHCPNNVDPPEFGTGPFCDWMSL